MREIAVFFTDAPTKRVTINGPTTWREVIGAALADSREKNYAFADSSGGVIPQSRWDEIIPDNVTRMAASRDSKAA